jgi:hypothetical protein
MSQPLLDGAPYVVVCVTNERLTWQGFTDRIEALRASQNHRSVAILQGPVSAAEYTAAEKAQVETPAIRHKKGSTK